MGQVATGKLFGCANGKGYRLGNEADDQHRHDGRQGHCHAQQGHHTPFGAGIGRSGTVIRRIGTFGVVGVHCLNVLEQCAKRSARFAIQQLSGGHGLSRSDVRQGQQLGADRVVGRQILAKFFPTLLFFGRIHQGLKLFANPAQFDLVCLDAIGLQLFLFRGYRHRVLGLGLAKIVEQASDFAGVTDARQPITGYLFGTGIDTRQLGQREQTYHAC